MAAPGTHRCLLLLPVLLRLHSSLGLNTQLADSSAAPPIKDGRLARGGEVVPAEHPLRQSKSPLSSPFASRRTLLQVPRTSRPFSPLKVLADGRPCVLFQARKLSLRYERQKQLDLTERAFSPQKDVDISESVCSQDKATLLMRFGDVEGLGGLSIRLQLSNTFYESPGQWWFSVESVSVLYNTSEEAVFSASEVYAPSSSSYHCSHVSSLQRHRALLVPSGDHARRWAVTFTNFQIQAFNISSGTFSPASDCAAFLTPAVLMGLITSLILLLVLAYGLHMLVHLKNIDGDNEHKADVYFPANAEQLEQGWDENEEK
ncbi:V-type proton ATPase subunit S1-like protein isoform X2 [Takifugu rubripes]|uniref:V-type proton ATPase subunit S1-like protein isoform X2 n=1 Tax=Takifugu rubripes TaxID=31033 RepID=UPI0011455496|nr:V-type proton ATPase subunit S1-like protein isoform X2 [Takifugu rubripes]